MKKLQNAPEAEAEACLINTLPDKVLSVILSSLTLKEAGRTSLVSRRWRYLWRFTSGPNFVFELQQGKIAEDGDSYKWNQLVTDFVNSVSRVMVLHAGTSVDKLIIGFSSIRGPLILFPHKSVIDPQVNYISEWIHFAMKKHVTVLELKCFDDNTPTSTPTPTPNPPFVNLPFQEHLLQFQHQQHLLCAQHLPEVNPSYEIFQPFVHYDFPSLDQFLSFSADVNLESSLVSLKSLRLVNIKIKGEMIHYFLSNCPCLEQLYIKGSPYLSNLNVVSPSLKSLGFCDCWNLKNLKISAKNLVSFEYMGIFPMKVDFCFENVPHLSQLIMNRSYMQSFIYKKDLHSMYRNQLAKLVLNLPSPVCVPYSPISAYRDLPRLKCLKELELVVAVKPGERLIYYVFWAMVCPSLSTFSIKFYEATRNTLRALPNFQYDSQTKAVERLLNSYHHKNLKLVTLIDFAGHRSYIEFVLNLLKVAKSLEKLIVKPENDVERAAITQNHAQQLETNLPFQEEYEKLVASGNFGEYRQPKTVKKLLNSYHHKHLKLVKLINFAGHPNYIEFAFNLLQVAKSLEKLIVKPENDLERVAIMENHAVHLQANLPVGAELEINWQFWL